jgi:hypothetical protein
MSDNPFKIAVDNAFHSEGLHIYETTEESGLLSFRFEFARLRDKSDDLMAELTIYMEFNGQDDAPPRRVMGPVRMNMLSSTWRREVLRPLELESPEYGWAGILGDIVPTTIARHRGFLKVLTDETWEQEQDAQAFLLEPFIAASGVTVLYGAGQTGKSTIATGLALAVRTGEGLFGHWVHQSGPVLWVDYEADEHEVFERDAALRKGMGVGDIEHRLHYLQVHSKLTNAIAEVKRVANDTKAVLVVIDSIGNARGGDANTSEDTIRLFRAMRSLDVPVLALDHLTKSDVRAKESLTPYGSVFTINAARMLWAAQFHEDSSALPFLRQVNLTNTKANRVAQQPRTGLTLRYKVHDNQLLDELVMEPNPGVWTDGSVITTDERIKRVLRDHGREFITAQQIAKEAEVPLGTCKNVMTALKDNGTVQIIQMQGRGSPSGYRLAEMQSHQGFEEEAEVF